MNGFYYKELTQVSFQELLNFASWMNEFFGHYPTIVGGWAVWCYTNGLGSRDIDVVFPDASSRNKALKHYFFYNDYEETGTFMEKTYVKRIETEKGVEEIIVDACTASDRRVIEDLDVTLPWKWAVNHSQKQKLEGDNYVYIPIPGLLLTYKIGAALGRRETLKTARETDYLQSKIWKDLYDVASLTKTFKDKIERIQKFLDKSGIDKHIEDFVEILEARDDILETHDLKKGEFAKRILS
ncbi:hypothetical protein AKJ39_04935 [candidate division MSBL1 archaeon SCGC-AAA259J03]|uniref:Uncharacterized protein n=1 Tax=candidate division MSBL1 archaeon SCGC-AAA259J03 TaxID=1698269 RepID=A0A656YUI1_9EURY|nr:hypothetical protein AKJ39_04935 [candidate division MSBL1 archaeon SCGC-AAA259J03]